ncbi:unnamed protein product [Linum trigynum]|uniref:Uncharacterized protein n=1 Tax=Linum trigynum TaxID=586398 RepID=A0AAV2CSC3_9ROSI
MCDQRPAASRPAAIPALLRSSDRRPNWRPAIPTPLRRSAAPLPRCATPPRRFATPLRSSSTVANAKAFFFSCKLVLSQCCFGL